MSNHDRYTVTAVISLYDTEERYPLGTAPSRRKAKRIGYQQGCYRYPLHSSAMFELVILDTVTGERVRAAGAEVEAWHRARALPTVADVGWW